MKSLVTAVYFGLDAVTVAAEADAKAIRFGWPAGSVKPQTRIVVELNLFAVVDLTADGILNSLSLQVSDLTNCDWENDQLAGTEPLTQAVSRASFENLAEGLIVPSARHPGGKNIIVFPAHLRPGSRIETHDEGNIPFVHGL